MSDGSGRDVGGNIWPGGRMRRVTRDWSGLPEPAVYLILKDLLPALADVLSAGTVCKGWRSVFTISKWELFSALPPLLVDRGSSPGAFGGFYSLMEGRFYRRKQPIAWPWMWSTSSSCGLSEMDVIGVSHGYWIVFPFFCSDQSHGPAFLMDPLSPERRIDLPPAPHYASVAFMTAPPTSPDCVIVATGIDRTLYCRLGDTQWARHSFKEGSGHAGRDASDGSSIVYRKHKVAVLGGKVYAWAGNGRLVITELFPRASVTVLAVKGLPQEHDDRSAQLMESNGEILYVADEGRGARHACPCPGRGGIPCTSNHRFVVRRLDLRAQMWVTLNSLGDCSLFLNWTAMSLTCVDTRWGGGRIYSFCPFSKMLIVFHMKDGTVEYHPITKEHANCDWLIPSFCYR